MSELIPHPEAKKRFKSFADNILDSNSESIHSIYITGSAITSNFDPKKSDINSVIVLKKMDLKFLEDLAPLGKKFRRNKIAVPLIMTPDYVQESLDVFPIEFSEIRLLHFIWFGEDLFKDIRIDHSNLRQQCERELKARLIGLRQGYISTAGDQNRLNSAFINVISGYIPLLRAIIMLHGKEPPLSINDVLQAVEEILGISMKPLKSMQMLKAEESKFSLDKLNSLFEDSYTTIEKLGDVINDLDG